MTRTNKITLAAYAAVCAIMLVWLLVLRGGMQEAALCLEDSQGKDRDFMVRKIAACTRRIEAGTASGKQLTAFYRARSFGHRNAQHWGQALEDLNMVLQREPRDSVALTNRGLNHLNLGDAKAALADFSRALAIEPDDAFTLTLRGGLYEADKQPDKAKADMARAESLAPDYAPTLTNLAQYRASHGDCDKALAILARALKQDAGYARAWILKGGCQSRAGQYADAIASFDKALALGRNEGALYQRSSVYYRLGRYDRAVADLTDIMRRGGDNAMLLNQRCWFLATWNHDLPQALEDCNAALATEPGNAAILDSRGFVYLRLSDYRASVADYDAALKLRPKMPTSLYVRGIARRRMGDLDGDKDIAAALELAPGVAKDFDKIGLRP